MSNNRVVGSQLPNLKWFTDLLSLFQAEAIKVPSNYRQQVLAVKNLLNDDPSGLASSLMDFAINSALVNYTIQTNNDNLTSKLNTWLDNINGDLRGLIPTGLRALAKEYFRERWKGSSTLVLRTFWSDVDGLLLPTSLFFVEGQDIVIDRKSKDGVVRLGDEKYYLRVTNSSLDSSSNGKLNKNDIALPTSNNEEIFVQKPFESWGIQYPVPFLIKRGVYHNCEFLRILCGKGELVVAKALEYLFILKKGTEKMALEGHVTYDDNDLRKASEDLKQIVSDRRTTSGFSSYTTNFDSEISEYIPDYSKIINDSIYAPIQKKILAGLGLVEIVEGIAASRRESTLNPKPFISEIEQGISDFKVLLTDVIKTIIEKNAEGHKKWMSAKIDIISSPIQSLVDDKFRTMLRSLYDRGLLSKRTFAETVSGFDYDIEVRERDRELKNGDDETMYPPVTQNQEAQEYTNINKTANNKTQTDSLDKTKHLDAKKKPSGEKQDKTLDDRTGPEKKNFKSSIQIAKCLKCEDEFDLDSGAIIEECPSCGEILTDDSIVFSDTEHLEIAYIVKKKDGWHVISKKGENLGGPYDTKKEAIKRLQQVEFHKNQAEE